MKSSEKEALEHAGIEESDVQEIPEPEIQNHEVGIRVKQSTHIGPLPDPETLAGYERIVPGAAERILRQSEDQTRCLEVLDSIEKGSIDLAYLDPPFFTEKKHSLKTRDRTQEFRFDDIWGTDTAYSRFLLECISKVRDVLKKTAAIFVHCDNSANHIVRSVLDRVFGKNNFRSEIIWCYKRWSNSRKGLMPSHQNIYFYTVSDNFTFNPVYTPYSETTNIDQILQNRTRDEHNKTVYELKENGEFKHGKQKKGVPLNDVWEIPYLNPKAKERVGYPTQKPTRMHWAC